SQRGDPRSMFDIRGLGADNTLVLVDGRRMPGTPIPGSGFEQSDINAIPLHAIERIEILTGAAGGIHGFGALGGVVNVVLDRESRGLDFHATDGISSRGDGRQRSFEVGFGHTSEDGTTDFTLFGSHAESGRVLAGDREFGVRDRKRTFELVPENYPS